MAGLPSPGRSFRVGGAEVTLVNVGDFPYELKDMYTEGDLAANFPPQQRSGAIYFPNNSVLIASGRQRIVVDPGDVGKLNYSQAASPRDAPRPVPLVDCLPGMGFDPATVTHVVVTHLHFDHYAGVTRSVGGKPVLNYPNARHLVPAKDWEMPDMVEARAKGDRDVLDTLGVAEKAGLLDFVEGGRGIDQEVSVEPFPGESPGHQVVAVRGGGTGCYCVGDLYHLKEEVSRPELAATWADRAKLVESRKRFAEMASSESALVIPGHMSPGRIVIGKGGPSWTGI